MQNETDTTTLSPAGAEGEKRESVKTEKKSLTIRDLVLTAILLAAGAVLKFFVGSFVNFFGMKPNFIIAMYCMAIILIRPGIWEAAVIGIIAGAICQFFPGTPWLNFLSELLGALVMGLFAGRRIKTEKVIFLPALATFVSTIVSGGTYAAFLMIVIKSTPEALYAYVPIVGFTALINAIIVQVLYYPLKATLK